MSTLSNDIARCPGVGDDTEGWREGCDDCLRRTAPRPDPVWMMTPPPPSSPRTAATCVLPRRRGRREEMGRELFPAAERLNSGAGGFLPVPLE